MPGLPKSAYIPPHLRKQAAAASAATTHEAVTPCVQKSATPTSVQSTAEITDKIHALLNDSSLVSKQLISASSTPSAQEDKKSRSVQSDERVDSTQAVADDKEAEHAPVPDFPGWDAPNPEPKPCVQKTENPRWPRGPKPLRMKTVWPKNRDMKAVSTDSSSDGGITFRSDSNGDPDYDVKKLMDWNGDWLPAPEQWAARKGHTDRHFGRVIEDWMNGHDDHCDKPMEIDSHFVQEGCKELVPRYWILPKIEQDSLGTFWIRFTERAPSPISDIDVMADPPFWERYEDGVSPYSNGLVVPEANVDPADPENNMGGVDLLISATERVNRIEQKKAKAHARMLARQRRPLRDVAPVGPALEDRSIQPKSNVYFRPVKPADVEGIGAIYNHYVENTIYAPEFEAQNTQNIAEHVDTIVTAGLPFLVAVARGNQPRGPKGYVSERIVGYIYLDDWHDRSSIYRYTFKLELYVHPGYTSQNIGSCLLDKLLEMANTGYKARDGYEYRNDFDYLKTGPSRVIKTIILQVLKENGEKQEETSKFLKQFNFSCAGHIANMGFKFGKAIDIFMYRHTTTETIDANARPLVVS
ncbi:hypothetical protein FB567DRAFT_448374 [Paraphoma chrysanthemicola]|uniref:N-acetyltransferase domain-containing protein n=1 Tax=Paraphoma chrysanthemicola TaxID=798071 RepID=A0A8K0R036_9PLEO|nr:hypothetical protein FB567DRAFT_448374 [Paraphoma chrysanthemicola]